MYLNLFQRYRIIFLNQDPEGPHLGYKRIPSAINCEVSCVKYWINKYKKNQDLSDSLTGGPKRKTTVFEDSKIINMAISSKRNSTRTISCLTKTKMTPLSHTSIHNRLKEAGLKYQQPLTAPLLNFGHKNKWLAWALDHRNFDWTKCIFTDESTFQIFESPGKLWQSNKNRSTYIKVKHSQKIHVWGCFSYFRFGKIFFFKENLDSKLMEYIYKKKLLPCVYNGFGASLKDWI